MIGRKLHGVLCAFLLAVLSIAVMPARAAIYIGSWDPVFSPGGTPYLATLGWRGEAKIIVPDNCGVLGIGTEFKNNVTGNDCDTFGRAYVEEAEIFFYDTSAPNVDIASISWNYANLGAAEGAGVFIDYMEFLNGVLQNMRTTAFPAIAAPGAVNAYGNVGGYVPDEFYLQFLQAGLPAIVPPVSPGYSGPVLFATFIEDDCGGDCDTNTYRSDVESAAGKPQNFQFVPEPASGALLGAALLLAGLAGRRRNAGFSAPR